MAETASPLLSLLTDYVRAARDDTKAARERNGQGVALHVPGTGQAVTAAYEQLRNAAEYSEEHLLLQHAIRRFCARNLAFYTHRPADSGLAEELVTDLTQAGYLKNDAYANGTIVQLQALLQKRSELFWRLRGAAVSRETAVSWTLDLVSAEAETLLNPHAYLTAIAYISYRHLNDIIPRDRLRLTPEGAADYDLCLYIAVHRSLLKSDLAFVRHDVVRLYQVSADDLPAFITFNTSVDNLFTSPLTAKLQQAVNRYGAPLRILKRMAEERSDLPELLQSRQEFLDAFDKQTKREYDAVSERVTRGLLKSIVFILITKALIGLAIEVPYDQLVFGQIETVPLAINLFFPPLYMASLKFGIRRPTAANASALRAYIEQMLYSGEPPRKRPMKFGRDRISLPGKLLYLVSVLLPLALMASGLALLHFNIVQGAIFFIFISTASFLGFRLSRMARELELVGRESNVVSVIGDFLYFPFVLTGRWISRKYARVNAVARLLDLAIELPLKSALRLMRRWVRFLRDRHDEIV